MASIEGARPVALWTPGTEPERMRECDGTEAESTFYVLAADYDALRAEVERLTEWRRDVCERLGFDCAAGAEWDAAYAAADQHKQIAAVASLSDEMRIRAEAAEAKLRSVDGWIAKMQLNAKALLNARNQVDRNTGDVIEAMLVQVKAALNGGG